MKPDLVDKELLSEDMIYEPILASTISKTHKTRDVSSLSDLFNNPDDSTFRTRLTVVKATPGSQAIQLSKGKKNKVPDHFAMQFLVKDTSSTQDDRVYRIFLYTGSGTGKEFFKGLKPTDKGAAKEIDKHLETLERFNVHLDAVVERKGGVYFIKDTTLKF